MIFIRLAKHLCAAAVLMALLGWHGVASDAAAQAFIKPLSDPSSGGETTPQPQANHFDQVLAAQRLLYALGFSIVNIDGRLDSYTTHAIRSFQRRNNLPVDGQVSTSLLTFLSLHAADRMDSGDRNVFADLQPDDEEQDFDANDRAVIAFVQRTLVRVGFAPGRIDGVMVPATRQAIRDFQTSFEDPTEIEIIGLGEITPTLILNLIEFEDSVLGNLPRLSAS